MLDCDFLKVMMLKIFVISAKSGCHGIPMEMEHAHCYFLCEWDHHKMSFLRFVFHFANGKAKDDQQDGYECQVLSKFLFHIFKWGYSKSKRSKEKSN